MATLNSVPKSIHLPLSSLSTAPQRVLLYSATVGNADGSATLQLRDANSGLLASSSSGSLSSSSSSPVSSSYDSDHSVTAIALPSVTRTALANALTNPTSTLASASTSLHCPVNLDNALTIGYSDSDMLVDVLGTAVQTANLKPSANTTNSNFHNNNNNISNCTNSNSNSLIGCLEGNRLLNTNTTRLNFAAGGECVLVNCPSPSNTSTGTNKCIVNGVKNCITISRRTTNVSTSNTNTNCGSNGLKTSIGPVPPTVAASAVNCGVGSAPIQTVSASTNTVNKGNSYIKNCLIRSSSCSNNTNITSLAQIMSNSVTSGNNNNVTNNNNNLPNTNIGSNNLNNSSSNCSSNSNSNCSSSSNCSNSNDSSFSVNSSNSNSNSNSNSSCGNFSVRSAPAITTSTSATSTISAPTNIHGNRKISNSLTTATNKLLKKNRSKLTSPNRHGPQQCQICNKIFGNASALAKHKLTHSDERKYVCVMCSKAFKRQDHLNGHMMTHRNKKPYECKAEGCSKSYCDARSLRRHTENHHAGIITPQNQNLSLGVINQNHASTSNFNLSPATANGDANSPDGATCLNSYLTNGVGNCASALHPDNVNTLNLREEDQVKIMNVPLKSSNINMLSPNSSTSSMSSGSSISSTSTSSTGATITLTDNNSGGLEEEGLTREQLDLISKIMRQTKQTTAQVTVSSHSSSQSYKIDTSSTQTQTPNPRPRTWNMQLLNTTQNLAITVDEVIGEENCNSSHGVHGDTTIITTGLKEDEVKLINQSTSTATATASNLNTHLLNIVRIDQKPVECNLCHRKFKNTPALNGHMRLHGGYFKKDPETKKNEKKENNGPPLQTASIGVRALIEEKIISKRSKDLNKGAFAVPAPPLSLSSSTSGTLRRSLSDLDGFLSTKSQASSTTSSSTMTSVAGNCGNSNSNASSLLPSTTLLKTSNVATKTLLNAQEMGLPQSIEIFSTKQQQQKNIGNVTSVASVGVGTSTSPTHFERHSTKFATKSMNNSNSTTGISNTAFQTETVGTSTRTTSTDPKDSTLIELLKRGTRIAVTSKQLTNGGPLGGITRQIITANQSNQRTAVILPTEVQMINCRSKPNEETVMLTTSTAPVTGAIATATTTTTTTTATIANGSLMNSPSSSASSITEGTAFTLTEGGEEPMSLTLTQTGDGSNEVYTVTYATDVDGGANLFEEAEVYNVSEADMLLQTVDTMQLLNESDEDNFLKSTEHSEQYKIIDGHVKLLEKNNSVGRLLPSSSSATFGSSVIATNKQTLPNFEHFHSKEILNTNTNTHLNTNSNSISNSIYHHHQQQQQQQQQPQQQHHQQHNTHHQGVGGDLLSTLSLPLPPDLKQQLGSLNSPLHSPLAYPTPPSSHENVTQTSPYIDDNQTFSEVSNVFFNESLLGGGSDGVGCSSHDLDNDKILKLKYVLEDNRFDDGALKMEDLLNDTNTPDTECDLREFAEANLSFLDDQDQDFLNETGNATSPLSESFFNTGIGSAEEEVKEVLREVLTEDTINLSCESQTDNIIDLYYLPGLSLQSQMMPNSEDPLLSSSPRDFGQQKTLSTSSLHIPTQTFYQLNNNNGSNINNNNINTTATFQQHQQQQQQQQQLQQEQHEQQQHFVSSDINQVILNVPANGCGHLEQTDAPISTPNTMQYNLQNLPQVQIQTNVQQPQQLQQQQQQQSSYNLNSVILSTTNDSSSGNNKCLPLTLNEALIQPLAFATTTDLNAPKCTSQMPSMDEQGGSQIGQSVHHHNIINNQQQLSSSLSSLSTSTPSLSPSLSTNTILTSDMNSESALNLYFEQQFKTPSAASSSSIFSTPISSTSSITDIVSGGSGNVGSINSLPSVAASTSTTALLHPLSNQTNSILKRRLKGYNNGTSSESNLGGGNHHYNSSQPSKYQALGPYRSKLRKPSRTHYTPPPILNPERKGSGLYHNVLRELRNQEISLGIDGFMDDLHNQHSHLHHHHHHLQQQHRHSHLRQDEDDDDDDVDPIGLVDFSDESKVNLGSAYQASVPAFCDRRKKPNVTAASSGDDEQRVEIDEPIQSVLMWDPDVQQDEKILLRFIDLNKSSAVPLGSHSEEMALESLLKAQGNTATAVLSLLQMQTTSFQMKWSATDLEIFLKGLEKYGKNFSAISKEVRTKTTGDCVQMYYFWKKLCVDYKVTHLKTEIPPSNHGNEAKPYVCEQPDCSASFSSKAALHGHTRIHTYGRNSHSNSHSANHTNSNTNHSHHSHHGGHGSATQGSNSGSGGGGVAGGSGNGSGHQSASISSGTPAHSSHSNQATAAVLQASLKESNAISKDNTTDFPCKVCGKVFNKIKSRSAHMKTHRVPDAEATVQTNNSHLSVQQQQLSTAQQQLQSQ